MRKHLEKSGLFSRQFVSYALIGVSGVAIDFVLFVILTRMGVNPLIANFFSISAGIINNFLLNVRFTFKVSDHLLKRFLLFYGVGFLGLLLSEVLLASLHYGFGMGDAVAKLVTLPVILVFQFLLNKFISFGNMERTLHHFGRLKRHWPLFALLALYAAFSVLLIITIPAKNQAANALAGPDEVTHYTYNVQYILEHKSLPVSGRDDLQAYRSCRDNAFAQVPCLYSYVFYPGPNYVLSALLAGSIHKATGISPQVGARAAPLFFGLVFLVCTYATAYLIMRRRLYASLLTAAVAFLPQVVFTNSYVNLDAHSLAIASVIGLSLTKALLSSNRRWLYWSGFLLFGLLPLAKYNYFILLIPALLLIVLHMRAQHWVRKEVALFALYSTVGFLLLSSFWYIRNAILYHDILGQSYAVSKMTEFHALGQSHPLNVHSLSMLSQMHFFTILFNSFFFAYGAMFLYLKDSTYEIIRAVLIGLGLAFAYFQVHNSPLLQQKRRQLWLLLGLWASIVMMAIGAVIANSLHYDFQPQGRYLFPILVPTVLLVAYFVRTDKRLAFLLYGLLGITVLLIVTGVEPFTAYYLWKNS